MKKSLKQRTFLGYSNLTRCCQLTLSNFVILAMLSIGCGKPPAIQQKPDTFQYTDETSGTKLTMAIPENLDACYQALDIILSKESRETIKHTNEDGLIIYHRVPGMWMRNEWGLWSGSKLAIWFDSLGIHHPDEMSSIIIKSYWRYLNDKPIALEEQIKFYQDYWNSASVGYLVLCPLCKKPMQQCMSGKGVDPFRPDDSVNVYLCPKKHSFYYSISRGLYEPAIETSKRILDSLTTKCQ